MWDPFGSSSANITTWHTSPNERGTMNILSTCVITLILCVYTCLHLNLAAPYNRTWSHRFKKKMRWLLVGLFAPEFVRYHTYYGSFGKTYPSTQVAFVAVYEWFLAKNLEIHMRNLLDPLLESAENTMVEDIETGAELRTLNRMPHDKDHPEPIRKLHRWNRVHSHYALMGGYEFDASALPLKVLGTKVEQLTLSPGALLCLAEHEAQHLPDLSAASIQDKSKADGFAKTIVCLQAVWFFAQIIGRLAMQYPVSLLELNTLLHALCCLVVYAAWWHKPLDVAEPSLIHAPAICTGLFKTSPLSDKSEVDHQLYRSGESTGRFVNLSHRRLMSLDQKNRDNVQTKNHDNEDENETSMNQSASLISNTLELPRQSTQSSLVLETSDIEALEHEDSKPDHKRLFAGQAFCGSGFQYSRDEFRSELYMTPAPDED
jgi:hypothetical protein